ncbi:MAG TPA: nuclear transport factor 2 family protein, partial [Nocardioidaceae bacterium]|nr:nuclear transport factor 2 family protein [Nocardioidaceae bacterium]
KPYEGKVATSVVLRAVVRVFEDFRYTNTYEGPDGSVLVFEATVGGKQIQGADFVHANAEGLVDSLTVMIRPLSGLNAVVAAMGPMIEQIVAELSPQ